MKQTYLFALALAATAAAPAFASTELATAKNCMACHAVDRKIVGPAFKDVATKYAGQKGMDARLAAKIIKGGAGAWGEMPMPPNGVTQQEALALAKWVLSQK